MNLLVANAILARALFILTLGVLVAGLWLVAARREQPREDLAAPSAATTPGLRTLNALSQQAPFRPESINFPEVEVVVLGAVIEVLPSRWITDDGKVPPEFKGQEERTFGANIDLATPVILQVKEYWKNPQPSPVLLVRSMGGRDGDYEIRYSHTTLKNYLGRDVVALLQSPEPYADLGPAWRETWILPVLDGRVAQSCGKANLSECLLPVEELKSQMLAALAAGTP